MSTKDTKLDAQAVKAIESVLSKGDRAEVVPVKDGVKVLRVRREVVAYGDGKDGERNCKRHNPPKV